MSTESIVRHPAQVNPTCMTVPQEVNLPRLVAVAPITTAHFSWGYCW